MPLGIVDLVLIFVAAGKPVALVIDEAVQQMRARVCFRSRQEIVHDAASEVRVRLERMENGDRAAKGRDVLLQKIQERLRVLKLGHGNELHASDACAYAPYALLHGVHHFQVEQDAESVQLELSGHAAQVAGAKLGANIGDKGTRADQIGAVDIRRQVVDTAYLLVAVRLPGLHEAVLPLIDDHVSEHAGRPDSEAASGYVVFRRRRRIA